MDYQYDGYGALDNFVQSFWHIVCICKDMYVDVRISLRFPQFTFIFITFLEVSFYLST